MRLSEAMRIGASWSPQTRLIMKSKDGTCAMGAAYEGTFGTITNNMMEGDNLQYIKIENLDKLLKTYPILYEFSMFVTKSVVVAPIDQIIVSLNDSYCWTREEIADWIEMKELELGYHEDIEQKKENLVSVG